MSLQNKHIDKFNTASVRFISASFKFDYKTKNINGFLQIKIQKSKNLEKEIICLDDNS